MRAIANVTVELSRAGIRRLELVECRLARIACSHRPAGRRMRRLRAGPEPQRSDPRQFPARAASPTRSRSPRSIACRCAAPNSSLPTVTPRRPYRSMPNRRRPRPFRRKPGQRRFRRPNYGVSSIGSNALTPNVVGAAPQSQTTLLAIVSTASIQLPDPVAYRQRLATVSNSAALRRSARGRDPRDRRPGTAAAAPETPPAPVPSVALPPAPPAPTPPALLAPLPQRLQCPRRRYLRP